MSGLRVRLGRYPDGVWWWELVDTADNGYVITDGLEPTWEKASAVAAAYHRAESLRSPWPRNFATEMTA